MVTEDFYRLMEQADRLSVDERLLLLKLLLDRVTGSLLEEARKKRRKKHAEVPLPSPRVGNEDAQGWVLRLRQEGRRPRVSVP